MEQKDDGRGSATAQEDDKANPSFATALIFFLTLMASIWSLNLMNSRWRVMLPSDWLYVWLICMLIPYILVTGAAYNRIATPFSDKAFACFSAGILSMHGASPFLFPAMHVWNHGWDHQECFFGPDAWIEKHPEAAGRVSRYLCDDGLRECVVGIASEPKKGYVVEIESLPWYEPHFAVDETSCQTITVRLTEGERLPALDRRVAVRLRDCTVLSR